MDTKLIVQRFLLTSSLILAGGLTGCAPNGPQNISPKPMNTGCTNLVWDNLTGTWQCQTPGGHMGAYYYGGHWFTSASSLNQDKGYSAFRSSSSFRTNGFGRAVVDSAGHGGFGE